jgi:hypothetical protein
MARTLLAVGFLSLTFAAVRADDVITFPAKKPAPPAFFASSPAKTSAASNPGTSAKTATGTSKSFIDATRTRLDDRTAARRDVASNITVELTSGAQRSVVEAPFEALVLNAKQKELMSRRISAPSAKTAATWKALGSTIDVDVDGMPLQTALDFIAKKTGLVLVPDYDSAGDLLAEYGGKPVTIRGKKPLIVRDLLRQMLFDRGLAYLLEDDCVRIVSAAKANATMVVRTYDVTGLVNTPLWKAPRVNAIELERLIRITVEPTFWGPNGPGQFTILMTGDGTFTLTVRANAEAHFTLDNMLTGR